MLTLTYEYKLIPTQAQIDEMNHILDVCTSVWNDALRERKDWIASRKCPVNACSIEREYIMSVDTPYPGYIEQCKALTEAKKTDARLSSVNAQVLQQVLKKLDNAFKDMKDRNSAFLVLRSVERCGLLCFLSLGRIQLLRAGLNCLALG